MDTTSRVRLLIEPLVADADVDLYDLEYAGGVLRVTVDRPDGVDMSVIGPLTRAISRMLDEADPIAGAFTLEVSSPGLERTLRTVDHFVGAVGSQVNVKTQAGVEGDRRIKGTLVSADPASQTIEIEPRSADPGTLRKLQIDEIERAKTLFEWGPAPKPGSGNKPGSKKKSTSSSKKKAAKS